MFNKRTWKEGEKITQEYMKKNGYKIVYTNFSCVGVELDIVAILAKKVQYKIEKNRIKQEIKNAKNIKIKQNLKQKLKIIKKSLTDLLVITEVKARQNEKFGSGFDAISTKKKVNIIRGAKFLLKDKRFQDKQIRFDVASVDNGKVTYIENAFDANI